MGHIRCMIAGFTEQALADILHNIVESSCELEVIGHINDRSELADAIQNTAANVVLMGVGSHAITTECADVFAVEPNAVVVGIANEGRSAALYVNNIGSKQLIDMVTAAFKHTMQ